MISNYDTVVYMVDPQEYTAKVREMTLALTKGADKPGEPPAWWDGDEDASQSGLLAAQQLGMRVN